MYSGQGNYPPQFRPPQFQQSQASQPPLPPFQQAPSGPLPPQYQHSGLPPQQHGPSYLHPPPQPYLPPAPPTQGNSPMPAPYSHPNPAYPSNHVSQPMPPPPRMFFPPPAPPQGQVLFHIPPPPPPAIQHVPVHPPPLPAAYVSVTPASFAPLRQSISGDVFPPSSLPLPPPPPPSSPPPIPPSPPPVPSPTMESSGAPEAPPLAPPEHGNIDASLAPNDSEAKMSDESKHLVIKEKASGDISVAPPKPADEEVVRKIEVLCQFMVNLGPDFENSARAKEAGNPQFAFLFGGEPGSEAAVGHEYFQWMKRKCLSKKDTVEDKEDLQLSRALKGEGSSQFGDIDNEGVAASPANSDMDMEDDVGQTHAEETIDELSKQSAGGAILVGGQQDTVNETFLEPRGTTGQLSSQVTTPSIVSSTASIQFLYVGKDEKGSSLLEDVSPVRQSPDATEDASEENGQGSARVAMDGSGKISVASNSAVPGTMETSRLHDKDGSPFCFIQDYASDDSEEDDKMENVEVTAVEDSSLQEDKKSKLIPSLISDNVSSVEIFCKLQTGSNQLAPLSETKGSESLGSFPEKATSQSVICSPDERSNEVPDLQDDKRDDDIVKCGPPPNNNILIGDNRAADYHTEKHLGEHVNHESAKLEIDEFGRLVKKSASDSDSDEVHHSARHVKRGRNRSRSRSPQESRRRHRSRSPRREKRSRSHSWSPGRARSKSPPAFKRNVISRREWDQPSECFDFKRGRCFRGASCRFLHRDSTRHVSRQQQYDTAQDSGNHKRHDASPLFEPEKTVMKEMDIKDNIDAPHEDSKSIEMLGSGQNSGGNTGSVDAGDLSDKGLSACVEDKAVPTINNNVREVQVTDLICKEAINHVEKPQVEEVLEKSKSIQTEEPSSKSSQTLQDDSTLIQSASSDSNQPQGTHPNYVSQPQGVTQFPQEGSSSHPIPQPLALQSMLYKDYPSARFSGPDVNTQPSQQVPPGPPGPPLLPHYPSNNSNIPFSSQHPTTIHHPLATGYHSQPLRPEIPSQRPVMANEYHTHNTPPNPAWYNVPPPPPTSNVVPPRHDFNSMMRPGPPGGMNFPIRGGIHPQTFHPGESSQLPPYHMDEFRRRPLSMGTHQNHFSHPLVPEDPQKMSDSQRDYHLRNQSSHEEARAPLPGQGLASSSPFFPGNHPQSVSLPFEPLPNRLHSFSGEHVDVRTFSREEFSNPATKDLPHSHQLLSYGQQQIIGSNYPSNIGPSGLLDPSLQRFPSSFLDNRPPHYNPFASTFELVPPGSKFAPNLSGRELDQNLSGKFDSSFSSGHASVGPPELRLTSSMPDSKKSGELILPRAGLNSQENADVPSDVQNVVSRNPVAGDAYDPLFDSIEHSNARRNSDHVSKPNAAVSEAGITSKLSSSHKYAYAVNSKQKESAGAEHMSEVDEFGEVATDAEVGAVENASPQLIMDSPDLPLDMENIATGEIEIDQDRSPVKSKKSKDSRSMRLFKIALADFVKEVLKPSWRQGNMSKEAFKTIVKKTVEKVSSAMPSHQIPKSQAKINQYVESSQRKLTKLVMGYVDKYVKM